MDFEHLRIKDVRAVVRYRSSMKHWHSKKRKDHFIGLQLNGSARHTFSDRSFVLSGNCVYFFNRREDYEVELYEPGEAFSVHFTTYEEIDTPGFCIPIEHPDEILALLQRLEVLSKTGKGNELMLLSTLYRLCSSVSSMRQKAYFQKDARMLAARNYIDLNFKDPDCLADAVAQSRLSYRRFSDLFKQSFDMTPNRYLTVRKIRHAKSLLETQSLTVSETAELCGFSNVYYFSKVFKQICGVPPTKWK